MVALCNDISQEKEYAPFLKRPEVQFSSASTEGLLKLLTVEKAWKQVHVGGWVGNLAESNGVLLGDRYEKDIKINRQW